MYTPANIEEKWRVRWEETGVYRVSNHSDRPKYYILDMFPYPSGSGLHVGHPLGYIASDILSRYKRLCGYNVLHPMGFDAFGLPAEQYAIDNGIHPAVSTADNIRRYKAQLRAIGLGYDWSREISTCAPAYYRWTQWIFLRMFNSFYDQEQGRARPIAELVAEFEQNGNRQVRAANSHEGEFDAAQWRAMSAREQADVLMNYRLMYRKVSYVNWCEALNSVLSNDEVVNGVSERGGHPVIQRPMLQWSMRITAYAERLLEGLERVDFPEALIAMQRNWIGRSEGAQIFFKIADSDKLLEIYTTRPDTIFGATFMVLAPEHDLVAELTAPEQADEIVAYLDWVKSRTELDRKSEKTVSGAFTGAYALHPFTNERLPIYIAEYVLKGYGAGAIMAVPGDDERDLRFAEKFNLPVIQIVDKSEHEGAGVGDRVGRMIHSDFLNGMEVGEAISAACARIEQMGIGKTRVQYKLRDVNYSRQRYWGEPFPIAYDADVVAHALPDDELPLELPYTEDFRAAGGKGPLDKMSEWKTFRDEQGRVWLRETDTMPGFAGSSWYFLRFMDPHNHEAFASSEAIHYWRDVDFYIGGAEHAVGHLLYSRMWHKFLYDYGMVPTDEPYRKLVNQGMIQGIVTSAFLRKSDKTFLSAELARHADRSDLAEVLVHADFVTYVGEPRQACLTADGIAAFKAWRPEYADSAFVTSGEDAPFYLRAEVGKMSKSKYNVVNPDDIVAQYGADCFRMYEMFLGPIEASKPWDTKGITGTYNFLKKVWALYVDDAEGCRVNDEAPTPEALRALHGAIKRVTADIERFSLNTCVSSLMIAVNELSALKTRSREALKPFVILLSPFAPFIAEELWERMGCEGSVCDAAWPAYDETWLRADTITYPVQINGKLRAQVELPADADAAQAEAAALALDQVQKWLEGNPPKKVVFVPKRMINIVA